MRLAETFSRASSAFKATMRSIFEEDCRGCLRGEVFLTVREKSGKITHEWHRKNLIVKDASIILARLLKDNQEAPHGAFVLAMGTGDAGWDPMNPPAPTVTQRSLYSELTRKTFSETRFIDAGGSPVGYPTNIVDFTTTYSESEAVGPLVEMGILGGNISTNMSIKNPVLPPNGPYDATKDLTQYETMINYLTFPVLNKPATSTLSLTWRLSL
jgi:hypothetical protein